MSNEAKKITLLAVDDSALILNMITTYLEGTEFTVVGTAKDGKQAVEKYRQLKPDVVLLDIIMPGDSGIDTLSNILSVDQNACVVMVSSLGTEDAVVECLKKGAKSFFQKPFEQEEIISFLRNLVKQYKK